jgi:hypothetical protein
VLGTAVGTIQGLCLGQVGCTPSASAISIGDPDVAHGMTTIVPTDVFGTLDAVSGTGGTFRVRGFSDDDTAGLINVGVIGTATPTATTAAIRMFSAKKNGTGVQALGATETLLTVENNGTVVVRVLGDGSMTLGVPLAFGQGGTGLSSAADDTVMVSSGSAWQAKVLTTCTGAGKAVTYDAAANTWGCNTIAGAGGNYVEAEVDFGAAGNTTASVAVTGQAWVGASSVIACAPTLFATADRDDGDEDALIENLTVTASTRSVGVGFTVYAHPAQGVAYGRFKIHCTGS